jgi:hypothetical protein
MTHPPRRVFPDGDTSVAHAIGRDPRAVTAEVAIQRWAACCQQQTRRRHAQ